MIYEYAVDPSLFTNIDKVCFLLESFGREKGRLISELKKDHWIESVRKAIHQSGNKDVERRRLMEALIILAKRQKALYQRQQQLEDAPDWLTLTQIAHSTWPYRGILVEQYDGEDEHYLARDIHLGGKQNWIVPTSITVDREAAAMIQVVSPLLANAREVMLVDRNFRLENEHGSSVSKYKNVLLGFLKFLAHKPYGPSVRKLTYHIGDQYYTAASLQDHFVKYVSRDFPPGIRLEFIIWPKSDLHDRYILTDIGGIDCGIGLDEYTGSSTKTVTLKRLSNTDHSSEWSKFKQRTTDIVFP